MIERSITHYLANHDRRKDLEPPAAPSWPSAALNRSGLGLSDFDIEDIEMPEAEPEPDHESETDASLEAKFEPLIEELPSHGFERYPPEKPQLSAEEQQELIDEHVQRERQGWIAAESDILHERINASFEEMETRIAAQVARILQPFLQDSMKHLAVTALVQRIEAVGTGENGPVLRISGPQDLLDAMQIRLADRANAFTCHVAATPDVQVIAGSLLMETSLAEWVGALRAATGEDSL